MTNLTHYDRELIKELVAISKIEIDISQWMKSSRKQIVFLGCYSGTCNRLRTIASYRVLSAKLNIPFKFILIPTRLSPGIAMSGSMNMNGLRVTIGNHNDTMLIGSHEHCVTVYHKFSKFLDMTLPEFTKLHDDETSHLLDNIVEYHNLTPLHDQFIKDSKLCNYTALHIRRGDFVNAYKKWLPNITLTPTSYYIKYVRENVNGPFFLSTDCEDVRNEFIEHFGDLVKFHNHEYNSTEFRAVDYKSSMLDLYTLSQAHLIVISPNSTFSSFAITSGNTESVDLDRFYNLCDNRWNPTYKAT